MVAEKILVVDDEITIAEAVQAILEDEGYEVILAPDGRKGLQAAREHDPQLILADLMMPVMSGVEMCRELKADPQTWEIPIVVMSAVEHMMESVREHRSAVIRKPFDLDHLIRTVARVLRETSAAS